MEMTQSALRAICKEHKLYRTPELNDNLYCNHKGFIGIANLEPYKNLKALYLEGNVLRSLEGLPPLADLKCLFVQNNCLGTLAGIEHAPALASLNVSSNCLPSLAGIEACAELATLTADHNNLEPLSALEPIAACTALQTLDLQHNNISDPGVVGLLRRLPALRCLYLKGNPVVGKVPSYRKALIAALPELTYLDDRPVFEEERRCAEAWARGGMEEERAERQRFKDAEEAARRCNFEWMQELRRSGFRKRREMLGLPPGDTDPMLDGMSDGEPEFEEPMELVDARARLAQLAHAQGGEALADPATVASSGAGADQGAAPEGQQDADARDYFAAVRECQAALDAGGAALMPSDRGVVAALPAAAAAGEAMLAALATLNASGAGGGGLGCEAPVPAGAGAVAGAAGGAGGAREPSAEAPSAGNVAAMASGLWGSSESDASGAAEEQEPAEAQSGGGARPTAAAGCAAEAEAEAEAEAAEPFAGAAAEGCAGAALGVPLLCAEASALAGAPAAPVAPEDVHVSGCEGAAACAEPAAEGVLNAGGEEQPCFDLLAID